jgi:hypothetical protein
LFARASGEHVEAVGRAGKSHRGADVAHGKMKAKSAGGQCRARLSTPSTISIATSDESESCRGIGGERQEMIHGKLSRGSAPERNFRPRFMRRESSVCRIERNNEAEADNSSRGRIDSEPRSRAARGSTAELTERIARLQYPAAVRKGVPFVYGPDQKYPFSIDKSFPLLPAIHSALSGAFRDVDFELILHAVEQLQPLVVSADPGYLSDRYHPVIGAFTEVRRRFDLLCDWTVLLAVRRSIISEIYTAINSKSVNKSGDPLPLHTFIQILEKEFQISVFALNYDDLVDGARLSWFDGFTGPVEEPAQGPALAVSAFDARSFDKWRDANEPVLAHLHGSVRFGYLRGQFGVGKYSDSQAAVESLEVSVSDQHSAGQIVSASPIISGLSKVAKLALNPEPFGYYYRAFIDAWQQAAIGNWIRGTGRSHQHLA